MKLKQNSVSEQFSNSFVSVLFQFNVPVRTVLDLTGR